MVDILKNIISNILTALYQLFWFSVFAAVLFMFAWKSYPNVKQALRQWVTWFKTESSFRRMFFLVFYTMMILFRTLFNRSIWANPVSNVFGGWTLYENGELTTEAIENVMLMIPFTALLLWRFQKKILGDKVAFVRVLWTGTKYSFLFSLSIEMLQLFLRLGTWQLSDIFYNTLGGAIGGVVYWIGYEVKKRK